MGNKLIYLLLTFILPYSTLFAQEHPELSESGQRHWKAATVLLEIASTPDELSNVIAEFELVTMSDSTYADTYYNLGKLYTKLGKEWGDECFDSAKKCFNKYLSLRPDEAKLIEDEIYIVETIRKSTEIYRKEKNKLNLIGTWKDELYPGLLYVIRINESEYPFKVQVSTGNDERFLYTYGASYDGETLSFTVRDITYGRNSTSFDGKNINYNKIIDYDYWKVTIVNNKMHATWVNKCDYYLNNYIIYKYESRPHIHTYIKEQ